MGRSLLAKVRRPGGETPPTPVRPAGAPAGRTTCSAAGRAAGELVVPETETARRLLVCSFHLRLHAGGIFLRGVARRSFGLVRHDLWLQIDPSAAGRELVTS